MNTLPTANIPAANEDAVQTFYARLWAKRLAEAERRKAAKDKRKAGKAARDGHARD